MSLVTYYCEGCQKVLPEVIHVMEGKPRELYHLASRATQFGRLSVECGPVVVVKEDADHQRNGGPCA